MQRGWKLTSGVGNRGEKKLESMQEKLMQGGKLLDKAAKQEAMLRRAQLELEERKEQEEMLAHQVRAKEEDIFALEEKHATKQDEADDKTRKLKKLWQRLQSCQTEANDVQEEFQREREDMLETIRQLSRQLKLKELLMNNFVPPEEERKLERCACWNHEKDSWDLVSSEFSGNHHHGPSADSLAISLTQERDSPHRKDCGDRALALSTAVPNPYHHYSCDRNENGSNPPSRN